MAKITLVLGLLVFCGLCLVWGTPGWGRGHGWGRGVGRDGGWGERATRERHGQRWDDRRAGRKFRDRMSGHRSSKFRMGFGPAQDPWFSLGVEFNKPFSHDETWWSGPNVCYTESQTIENVTSEISSHMSFQSVVCDGSDTTFRCTKSQMTAEGKRTLTEVFECCAGFTRKPSDFGCPRVMPLLDLPGVLENLKLTELTALLNSSGLSQEIFPSDSNFTIFAPDNEALKTFVGAVTSQDKNIRLSDAPNVIMVSKEIQDAVVEDSRNVLLGHMAVGRYTTPQLADDMLIETASPFKSSIRINTYSSPVKLTTANCVRVTSADHLAKNGVVHVVDRVLKPVPGSLLQIISKNPELSTLKTALGSSSFGAKLREDGSYTLFAPTDAAFQKYQGLMKKVTTDPKCLENILKNHILPHVICSSVIEGEARTRNLLQRYANLSRDTDDKLYVDGAQIVNADVMASNGVLHIIDDVLLPDEALGLLELAAKNELTEFTAFVAKAGLTKDLDNLENVTMFVPSNEAIQALPADVVQTLTQDPTQLQAVLQYHVGTGEHTCDEFYNDYQLGTLAGPKLRINEYSTFPFGRRWTRTVQCTEFESRPIRGCNGIMYVIDKVLIPPKGNVVDVLAQDARFSTLVELLKIAGLADALQENGPFTIFAPTNEAFNSLGSDAVAELKQNRGVLSETLQNHVTRDAVCCKGILPTNWINTQKVRMLSNLMFEIGKSRRDVNYIGPADITECDVTATNGVVHVINQVIMTSPVRPQPFSDHFWDYFW